MMMRYKSSNEIRKMTEDELENYETQLVREQLKLKADLKKNTNALAETKRQWRIREHKE